MKYTNKKCIEIMEKSKFPGSLTLGEIFRVELWTIFKRKKFYNFIDNLNKGMSVGFAFNTAKKL